LILFSTLAVPFVGGTWPASPIPFDSACFVHSWIVMKKRLVVAMWVSSVFRPPVLCVRLFPRSLIVPVLSFSALRFFFFATMKFFFFRISGQQAPALCSSFPYFQPRLLRVCRSVHPSLPHRHVTDPRPHAGEQPLRSQFSL